MVVSSLVLADESKGGGWTDGTFWQRLTDRVKSDRKAQAPEVGEVVKRRRKSSIMRHMNSLTRRSSHRETYAQRELESLSPTVVHKLRLWAESARQKVQEWHEIRDRRLILPDSFYKGAVDVLNILLMFYTFFELPFSAVFGDEIHNYIPGCERIWQPIGVTNLIVDFLFMLDVAIYFNTAYYNEESELVLDRWQIAKTYMRGWFFLDFLTSIPFQHLVCGFYSSSFDSLFLRLFKFLRLLKLSRLAKFTRILHRWELQLGSRKLVGMLRMVKFSTVLLFVAHITACVWMLLSQSGSCNPAEDERCICVDEGCYRENWLATYDTEMYESTRTSSKYLASIYYAVVTLSTVGYGDITPTSDIERGFSMMFALMGALIFGWCISSISELASDENKTEVAIKDTIREVNDFMQYANVPRSVHLRVQQQLLYASKKAPHRMHPCLACLPRHMLDDIVEKIFTREMAKDVPWLMDLDKDARSRLAWVLKPLKLKRREFLCTALESADEMYFLMKGEIAARSAADGAVVAKMNPGEIIGEVALFEEGLPFRTFSLQALTDCELLILDKKDLHESVKPAMPDFFQAIKDLATTKLSMINTARIKASMQEQSLKRCAHVHEQVKKTRKAMKHNYKRTSSGGHGDLVAVVGENGHKLEHTPSDSPKRAASPKNDLGRAGSNKHNWLNQLRSEMNRLAEKQKNSRAQKSDNDDEELISHWRRADEGSDSAGEIRISRPSSRPERKSSAAPVQLPRIPSAEIRRSLPSEPANTAQPDLHHVVDQLKEEMSDLEDRLTSQMVSISRQISKLASKIDTKYDPKPADATPTNEDKVLGLYGYTVNRCKVTMSADDHLSHHDSLGRIYSQPSGGSPRSRSPFNNRSESAASPGSPQHALSPRNSRGREGFRKTRTHRSGSGGTVHGPNVSRESSNSPVLKMSSPFGWKKGKMFSESFHL